MSQLQIQHGAVAFTHQGRTRQIFSNIDLVVSKGESLVLLGPSGCGKSTLLNIFAGFQSLDAGTLSIDQQLISGPSGQRAVVFQDDALLPWLNAQDNVALGLTIQGIDKTTRRERARHFLALVGLEAFAEHRLHQLSGGQRQRLGLARALAVEPDFLLLDEPFGSLDALTREKMQSLLLTIWQQTGVGLLLITHSVDEALLLASDLCVLQGPPTTLVKRIAPPYARRCLTGESVRTLKSEAGFMRARQQLLDHLLEEA